MFSRTDKTVDILPQTRANVGYVSNYEYGYVPLNHRGWERSFDSYQGNSKHVEALTLLSRD